MPATDVDADDVVTAVCRLPIDYRHGNVSAVEVLRRSGYASRRASVTIELLERCLASHADWVDAWFEWSADTRSSPAWWIREGTHRYEVGLFDPGVESRAPLTFDSRFRACAEYVHRVIEDIARVDRPPGLN